MSITEEMKRSMAATKADMDKAMEDPSFRSEVDSARARYAAMEMVESILRSASSMRKINGFRKSFHRDFTVSVSLDDDKPAPAFSSACDMAFA